MDRKRIFLLGMVALSLSPFGFAMGGGERVRGSAFVGATLINGTGSAPMERSVVLVSGSTIEAVFRDGERPIPASYQRIDLRGTTLTPGFINAHVHRAYDREQLGRWLRAGVTTVRDLGPIGASNFVALRDALNRDPGCARIVSATPLISAPGGYGSLPVLSPQDAERTVGALLDGGADVVKIAIEDDLQGRTWTLIPTPAARRIVEVAHARGVRVSAHISHVRNLPIALEAGVDDLAHMVVEPLDDALIAEIVRRGIYWVPTLELWQGVSRIHALDWDRIAIDNLGRFYRAGGKVALGTDFAGYVNEFDRDFPVTEISLMERAGMKAMDIIVAATQNAATVSGKAAELGTVERGKVADLVVFHGNPLADLGLLAHPAMVVHAGRVVPLR